MSAATTEPVIVVRKTDRDVHIAGGGTVTYTVDLDARWIGWVYDARRFTGVGFGGRTWSATWREDGDAAARSTVTGFRTRAAAVAALIATATQH